MADTRNTETRIRRTRLSLPDPAEQPEKSAATIKRSVF